jgi:hypothetical protein
LTERAGPTWAKVRATLAIGVAGRVALTGQVGSERAFAALPGSMPALAALLGSERALAAYPNSEVASEGLHDSGHEFIGQPRSRLPFAKQPSYAEPGASAARLDFKLAASSVRTTGCRTTEAIIDSSSMRTDCMEPARWQAAYWAPVGCSNRWFQTPVASTGWRDYSLSWHLAFLVLSSCQKTHGVSRG